MCCSNVLTMLCMALIQMFPYLKCLNKFALSLRNKVQLVKYKAKIKIKGHVLQFGLMMGILLEYGLYE